MLLDVKNLQFSIGKITILRNINLKISRGEVVGLVGRNGAGKTTTIKNIVGIYRPQSGKILFNGIDITHVSADYRIKLGLGYSPEDARVFPDLTVRENLLLPVWIRGTKGEDKALKPVFEVFPEIKDFLERKGKYLSGGQKKIVAIARALALDPLLLLLDEPFEGLAPLVLKRLKRAILKIRKLGKTVFIASSRISVLSDIIDKVYIIERGEILFEGSPSDALNNELLLRVIGR